MAFCIITDSASDIPESVIKEYDLYVMPTPVTIEGTDYFDGQTIFPDQFYEIQASGKEIKTYHINQFMFHEHFLPYAKRDDEVLYICFSTGIAGTFNAAKLAYEEVLEEYPGFKMTIIDSKCASVGYGLVVERLLRMQRNGAPRELLIEAANFFCEHIEHAVTVVQLDYLFKGGRLSRTSFLAGTVLDIKPIIIGDSHITEVPGLVTDPRNLFLSRRIPLNKSILRRLLPEALTDSGIGKIRTDKVNFLLSFPKINGKSRLMLTMAGQGNILFRKFPAALRKGFLPYRLLLPVGAPSADRHDFPPAPDHLHETVKEKRRPALHQSLRGLLPPRRGQILFPFPISIFPVYQYQTSPVNILRPQSYGSIHPRDPPSLCLSFTLPFPLPGE